MGGALARRDDVELFLSPADVVLSPRTLVQPDLFVVTKEPGTEIESWSEVGIPLLAVEGCHGGWWDGGSNPPCQSHR